MLERLRDFQRHSNRGEWRAGDKRLDGVGDPKVMIKNTHREEEDETAEIS
jgi:hypothetical protein